MHFKMLNPSFNAWYSILIFKNLVQLQVLQMKYATGGHLGRDKTLEKISARFYWRPNMTNDVKDFVSIFERFQRTNDKFAKPGSALRPISIEPEVWKQINLHNSYTHLICDMHN